MADPAKQQQQPTQEQIVEEDEFEEFAVEGEPCCRYCCCWYCDWNLGAGSSQQCRRPLMPIDQACKKAVMS